MLKVILEKNPQTKPATRFGLINGKVRTWNKSTKTRLEFRQIIWKGLSQSQRDQITKDPSKEVHVTIKFYMPIRKSASKEMKRLMSWGMIPHVHKLDVDNCAKFHLDLGNQLLWRDDNQLVRVNLEKEYSRNPRVEYFITLKESRMDDKMKAIYGHLSMETVKDLCQVCSQLQPYLEIVDHFEDMDKESHLQQMRKMGDILGVLCLNHAEKLNSVAKKLKKLDMEKDQE